MAEYEGGIELGEAAADGNLDEPAVLKDRPELVCGKANNEEVESYHDSVYAEQLTDQEGGNVQLKDEHVQWKYLSDKELNLLHTWLGSQDWSLVRINCFDNNEGKQLICERSSSPDHKGMWQKRSEVRKEVACLIVLFAGKQVENKGK